MRTMRQSKYQNQTWQGMLEWSDWEFRTTVINMLGILMDKVIVMQDRWAMEAETMEALTENQKEILERTL